MSSSGCDGAETLAGDFKKIASVKCLQRYPVHDLRPHLNTGVPIVLERGYGNMRTPSVIDLDERRTTSPTREIFGFLVAGASQMSAATTSEAFL